MNNVPPKVQVASYIAIKVISTPEINSLENEIQVLKRLTDSNHPNILNLLHAEGFQIHGSKHFFIVTERCDGDLGTYLERKGRKLPESEIRLIAQQLAAAFRIIRSENIVHRDLKPNNILINLNPKHSIDNIKIADFGFAKVLAQNQLMNTYAGSPIYMAPEILDKKGIPYTDKVDLWSIGIMLYSMATGSTPFQVRTMEELLNNMKYQEIPEIKDPYISPELKDLIRKLLVKNPEQRISWEDFFNHPLLFSFDPIDARLLYLHEILELAQIKSSNSDSLPFALNLYFKYLISLFDLHKSLSKIQLSSPLRERLHSYLNKLKTDYNNALGITRKIVAVQIQPSGTVEELTFERAMDLGRLGIVKEICKRYGDSINFYRKSIIILKGLLSETTERNSKQQLENFLDTFKHRLAQVESKHNNAAAIAGTACPNPFPV